MDSRHDEHMSGIYRLNVHEGDRVGVLVTDGDLGGPLDEVAKRTVVGLSGLSGHFGSRTTSGAGICTGGARSRLTITFRLAA